MKAIRKQNRIFQKAVWALLLCALTAICAAAIAKPARADPDITTGLVGHWTLNETSGPYADTVSGNDASVATGTPASTAARVGKGLYFNGSTRLDVTPASVFQNLQTFTWAGWVNVDDVDSGGYKGFFQVAGLGNFHTAFSTGELIFEATGWGTQHGTWFSSPIKITSGNWHHVAVAYDYTAPVGTKPTFYIDGKGVTPGSVAFAPSGTFSSPVDGTVSIGAISVSASSWRYMIGALDDVRIYDRILTAEDVAALYAAWPGHLRYNASQRVPEYYNESDWIAAAPGPYVPNAVMFDKVNDYLLANTGLAAVSDSKRLTGSFWFKTAGTGQRFFLNTAAGSTSSFMIKLYNATLILNADNSSGTSILGPYLAEGISDGNWHHILFSVDTSDSTSLRRYVDGAPYSGLAGTITNDVIDFTKSSYAIGSGTTGGFKFDGDLADFWLDTGTYIDFSDPANRRKFIDANGMPVDLGPNGEGPTGSPPDIFLSGDTANWHTNKGTGGGFTENGTLTDAVTSPGGPYAHVPMDGLVSWWRLDETSGTSVIDYASANDGTFTAGGTAATVQPASGVFGGALSFNGTDQGIDLGQPADLDFSGTNAFTISSWVYPTDTTTHAVILSRGAVESSASTFVYAFSRYGIDPTRWRVLVSDGATRKILTTPVGTASNGQWQYMVVTWDGVTISVYKDGASIGSLNTGGLSLWDGGGIGANRDTSIGWDVRNGQNFWAGRIDNVMVWNRALSASEIADLYNAGVCDNPHYMNGSVLYNTTHHVLQYCDGVMPGNVWRAMGPHPGPGGAGCSNPAWPEGSVIYNLSYNVLQYCDGVNWRALGHTDPCLLSPTPGTVCMDGTVYAGLSPDGNVPMYTTPTDQASNALWGTYTYSTGAASPVTGEANSANVYAHVQAGDGSSNPDDGATPNAFVLCGELSVNGHSDWYVPAKDELNVLYTNRAAIGGFDAGATPYYWSSSEQAANSSVQQNFSDGSQVPWGKFGRMFVRCVRK